MNIEYILMKIGKGRIDCIARVCQHNNLSINDLHMAIAERWPMVALEQLKHQVGRRLQRFIREKESIAFVWRPYCVSDKWTNIHIGTGIYRPVSPIVREILLISLKEWSGLRCKYLNYYSFIRCWYPDDLEKWVREHSENEEHPIKEKIV